MTRAPSFLVIQTAFIGDVVLATALVEKIHQKFPQAPIDFLLRKGNEDLLKGHPFLREVLVWNKKQNKIRNLFNLIGQVRAKKYTYVVNVHRFLSSGLITVLSGADTTIGFRKNPLSLFFSRRKKHSIGTGMHEVDRNQTLISELTGDESSRPRLYPGDTDRLATAEYRSNSAPYVCVAPASVWYTKQFPPEKWVEAIDAMKGADVYLLGSPSDAEVCEEIRKRSSHSGVVNLAGKLSFLESAALMEQARMNFVNDSAPMHLASAVNAPVTAVFCSTIPGFGFGPLSDTSFIVQTTEPLLCRPCGLHGYRACPEGHFMCATTIERAMLLRGLDL